MGEVRVRIRFRIRFEDFVVKPLWVIQPGSVLDYTPSYWIILSVCLGADAAGFQSV